MNARDRYNAGLAAFCGIFWIAMAIAPVDRQTWLLENMLVFVWVPLLVWSYRRMPLSRISYTLCFLFFCMHTLGAHYTYSLVPYDDAWRSAFGASLHEVIGWERNHYDRFVHLAFGLLIAYPCREVFVRIAGVRGFWGYFFPIVMMMSFSTLYEMIEWAAAVAFGGDLGIHYLGTQGDEWDGHKDMALASLGAVISMTITLFINLALQRDFAAEWQESLRVKDPRPLGEDAIARMLHDNEESDQP